MGRAARPRPPAPNAPRGSPTCSGFAAGAQEGTPCSSDHQGQPEPPRVGAAPHLAVGFHRRLPEVLQAQTLAVVNHQHHLNLLAQLGRGTERPGGRMSSGTGWGGKAEAAAKSLLPPVPHHCHPPSWGQAGGRDGAAPELVPASPPGWPRPSRASSEALVRVLGQGHMDRRRI